MDIDGDGRTDILSGSYSRHDPDMAGLFWVLKGQEGGTFAAPTELRGTDGEPLIVTPPADLADPMIAKICTRPTAVDFDGDGHLDVVAGNFEGTFHLFRGQGQGRFAPTSTPLLDTAGEPLKGGLHSDPVFVDWDGDGDQDLVSGATSGVFWSENVGQDAPAFRPMELVLEYQDDAMFGDEVVFGEDHLTEPQGSIRVWIDDLDGDGRFDLLMGDNARITRPAEGLTEEQARAKLADWDRRQQELMNEAGDWDEELQERMNALWEERAEIVDESGTGFVWVAYQQAPSES